MPKSIDPQTVQQRILRRVDQIKRANELAFSRPGCCPVWLEVIARKQRETIAKLRAEIEVAL